MKKVKAEYEICTANYNSIMMRNSLKNKVQKEIKITTTTTTPYPLERVSVGSIRRLVKRQQKSKENSTQNHQQNSSNKDHGNEQIKTVCW